MCIYPHIGKYFNRVFVRSVDFPNQIATYTSKASAFVRMESKLLGSAGRRYPIQPVRDSALGTGNLETFSE